MVIFTRVLPSRYTLSRRSDTVLLSFTMIGDKHGAECGEITGVPKKETKSRRQHDKLISASIVLQEHSNANQSSSSNDAGDAILFPS